MQSVIQFLIKNTDVLRKVKEGTVSLVGVSSEEQKAILEVFFEGKITTKTYLWQ